MTTKPVSGVAEALGKVLGSVVVFFLRDNNLVYRWVKRSALIVLVVIFLLHSWRGLAQTLVTLGVVGIVVLALAARDSVGRGASTSGQTFFDENPEAEDASQDNDPHSQANIHNSLFHESDFNWRKDE